MRRWKSGILGGTGSATRTFAGGCVEKLGAIISGKVPAGCCIYPNVLKSWSSTGSLMFSKTMSWKELLDQTRLRALLLGRPSHKVSGESRTEYERDRDRTVYSSPLRRLIRKTQVFPLDPNDLVRTRLVHSLEVSTV